MVNNNEPTPSNEYIYVYSWNDIPNDCLSVILDFLQNDMNMTRWSSQSGRMLSKMFLDFTQLKSGMEIKISLDERIFGQCCRERFSTI